MRIKSVQLSWFRGAADSAVLDPNGKSIVIYGENGSGKSSFVDAVEYVVNDGKIGHLSHEQSGKRQEKAIPNTHMPEGKRATFAIQFIDDSEHKVAINRDGSSKNSGSTSGIEAWDYRRTILRQDEVARFIQNTKGEKYSALLPLLGLQHMEVAAENLRKLARSVEQVSKVKEVRGALDEILLKRKTTFDNKDDDAILKILEMLHSEYCPINTAIKTPIQRCKELSIEIDKKIAQSSTDQKQHLILKEVAELNLADQITIIRSISDKLTTAVEPLISEKLKVLESSAEFSAKLNKEEKINCPACGREIPRDAFQAHVAAERTRLQEIIIIFEERNTSIGTLCDNVRALKTNLTKTEIKNWRDKLSSTSLVSALKYLDALDHNALRKSCAESDLKAIETSLLPLIELAQSDAKNAPTDVQKLTGDKKKVEIALAILESKEKAALVANVGILTTFIGALEEGIRKEIAEQSEIVIAAITTNIQDMWKVLHPNEHIEDVRLHVPEDTEKAIDICLKFHGINQDSPRLTLSEGVRNSLGLCIFLAMAQREAANDRPIFLDDVVVSVDRNHRGMIVELLEALFSDRQLIVFTHDRDWFIELKQRLNSEKWSFKALMPYDIPSVGIRWSEKSFGFDDARKLIVTGPDLAGNVARKIMDIELALRAERMKIRLSYLHRERNDHRGAHEFLNQIIADGETAFEMKGANGYVKNDVGLQTLREADKLLVSFANKASHSHDVTKDEATMLIDACEKALASFDCLACKKAVHRLEDEKSKLFQCSCGDIRWRYGKV